MKAAWSPSSPLARRIRRRSCITPPAAACRPPTEPSRTLSPNHTMTEQQQDLFQKFAALASLLGLIAIFSFTSNAFFSVGNGMTVALQVTSIAYLGIAATCVIITGGIDLSVGAILALAGVVAAMLVKAG